VPSHVQLIGGDKRTEMRLRTFFVSTCALAATAAFVVPGMGASVHECVAGSPTAASYTWDFKAEANSIFQDLEILARQTRNDADQFQNYSRNEAVSWELQSDQLNILRQDVNDMGEKLCRLENIHRVLDPWQQTEVDHIAQEVQMMADNTQDAIVYLTGHEKELWVPTYQKYANNLYNEAGVLAGSLGNAVSYAKVSKEYRNLKHKLGVPSNS
jgi:hypothetical protein